MQGKADARLERCAAKRLDKVPSEILLEGSFFVTDANWHQGFARDWAGFHLPNTDPFISLFTKGKSIYLLNGEVRKILDVTTDDIYLNVILEGEPIVGTDKFDTPFQIANLNIDLSSRS